MFSAITGAIAALKGPLHGGANEEAMKMLEEIGSPENAAAYVARPAGAQARRSWGSATRVYRTMDPRATVLKRLAREIGERARRRASGPRSSRRSRTTVYEQKEL